MNMAAAYAAQGMPSADERLLQHAPLVKRIAHHLMARLPDSIQLDDLLQAGMIGLLEAVRNFDESQGASFETYAGIRIRGAMLDEVRRNDWFPRSVHRKARLMADAVQQVEGREGRDAHDWEVAREMGVSQEEYHRLLREVSGHRLLSFDDVGQDESSILERLAGDEPGIVESLQKQDLHRLLSEAIAGLPERERVVMALYYDQELNLKEIGQVLGVTESRICQIHGQALLRLRARFEAGAKDITC